MLEFIRLEDIIPMDGILHCNPSVRNRMIEFIRLEDIISMDDLLRCNPSDKQRRYMYSKETHKLNEELPKGILCLSACDD